MKSPVVQFQIMRLLLTVLAIALALNGIALAQKPQETHQHEGEQDPTKTLPKAYQLEFENDWVRIVRVHYEAKGTLPEHEHPGGVTVYLYLNASDGVVFTHDNRFGLIPRPPVVAGAIRIGNGPLEHHSVTNNAATPSDFVRVLLKTSTIPKRGNPVARMSPSAMEYDHPMMHLQRINVQPGTTTRIEAKNFPVLRLAWIPDKTEWRVPATEGFRFLDKGTTEDFAVSGNVPMQLVTIELRTPIGKTR